MWRSLIDELPLQAALLEGFVAGAVVLAGVYLAERLRRNGDAWRELVRDIREAERKTGALYQAVCAANPGRAPTLIRWAIVFDGLGESVAQACDALDRVGTAFRLPVGRARKIQREADELIVRIYSELNARGVEAKAVVDPKAFSCLRLVELAVGKRHFGRRQRLHRSRYPFEMPLLTPFTEERVLDFASDGEGQAHAAPTSPADLPGRGQAAGGPQTLTTDEN